MTVQDTFLDILARRLSGTASAATIFGAPVERGDVTVIPVAKAAYGFGGGSGTKSGEEGFAGGGGVRVAPVGYIEIRPGGVVHYRPIRDWTVLIPTLAASATFDAPPYLSDDPQFAAPRNAVAARIHAGHGRIVRAARITALPGSDLGAIR